MLDFKTLRDANLARCSRWHPGGVNDWSMSDWATAVAGELGEACNVIKKLNRVRDGLPGNTVSEETLKLQLGAEIADTMIYLDLLAARAGLDLAAHVIGKFNAVSVRMGFPERLEESVL